jgi:hypothetical protein
MDRFDLNEAIRSAIILTHGEVVKIGASIQVQLGEPLPFFRGDRVQIQQVMVNLIVNAIQAMSGDGDIRRELQISTETDEAEGVRVGVRDTGPGLAPRSLPRLFEPFYTTKAEGMGMGLAICRSLSLRLMVGSSGPRRASHMEPCFNLRFLSGKTRRRNQHEASSKSAAFHSIPRQLKTAGFMLQRSLSERSPRRTTTSTSSTVSLELDAHVGDVAAARLDAHRLAVAISGQ